MTQRQKDHDRVELALLGATGVLWSALPDYVSSPSARRLLRGGLVLAGGTVAGLRVGRTARDDTSPTADATTPPATPFLPKSLSSRPWAMGALTAAGLGAVVGGLVVSQKIDDAIASALAKRGVSHPYTVVGLVWGVLGLLTGLVPESRPDRDRPSPQP